MGRGGHNGCKHRAVDSARCRAAGSVGLRIAEERREREGSIVVLR